jgi:Ca-activated chloride channel homolog
VKLLPARIVPPCGRVFLSYFLISFAISAIAPRPSAQFRAGVDLVEVYATVTDARGEPVVGLTKADFVVEEDGTPQDIGTFSAGDFPLALAIGIDRSFSISKAALVRVSAAVRGLLTALRSDDEAMLVAIGSQTEVLAPLSRNRETALAALDGLEPWGTTPLYDATLLAVDAIESASGRRALILLSDGTDRYSETTPAQLLGHVRQKNVLIYPITLNKMPSPISVEMATVTGGRSFQVGEMTALPATLATIAKELRFQYLLGYVPASRARAGWRSIHVAVRQPNLRVRARDGYTAR